jgi:hypothetical protein
MLGHPEPCVEMREADDLLDRVVGQIHDLHHRAGSLLQHPPRRCRLPDPGDDHPRRPVPQQLRDDPLLDLGMVAGVGDLDPKPAVVHPVVDASKHVGEDVLRDRRDQHRNHATLP